METSFSVKEMVHHPGRDGLQTACAPALSRLGGHISGVLVAAAREARFVSSATSNTAPRCVPCAVLNREHLGSLCLTEHGCAGILTRNMGQNPSRKMRARMSDFALIEGEALTMPCTQTSAPFHGAMNCPHRGLREATRTPQTHLPYPKWTERPRGHRAGEKSGMRRSRGLQDVPASVG
jgi:hypothetical protein